MSKKSLCFFKYLILFCLFLASYLFLPRVAADETWSYGFSYNVVMGLVPYRDFNMIVPPLFPFFFSIFLFFYKGIFMFHIEQALMLTGICYLLEKLLKEKYLIAVFFLLFLPNMIYNLPTYNTLCLFFTLILILLEKKNASDITIGIVAGLVILTKQSIGAAAFLICLFLVRKDFLRIMKRLFGVFFPVFLVSLYLIGTHSFLDFFDQCVLGMFDFSGNGKQIFSFFHLFLILFVFFFFLFFAKHKKVEKEWSYAFGFYIICFPLLDPTHFLMGAFVLFLVFLSRMEKEISKRMQGGIFSLMILLVFFHTLSTLSNGGVFPNDFKNYEYRYLNPEEATNLSALREYRNHHLDQEIVILSSSAYIFKLTNEIPIEKLDLINVGNWGRDGTQKIIKEIHNKDLSNTLFLVNEKELNYQNQVDKDVLKYVIQRGEKVDHVLYFDVYQLNLSKNFEK